MAVLTRERDSSFNVRPSSKDLSIKSIHKKWEGKSERTEIAPNCFGFFNREIENYYNHWNLSCLKESFTLTHDYLAI